MLLIKTIRGFSVVLAGLTGKLAFAGFAASLTYAPGPSSVPTLSEWTLLALTFLVAMVSYRHLRSRLHGRPLAAVFLAGAAAILALAVGYVGEQAMAVVPSSPDPMTLPAGGTIYFGCNTNGNLLNNTSITMAVTAVNKSVNVTTSGTCTSLPTVAPSASCSITVQCSPP